MKNVMFLILSQMSSTFVDNIIRTATMLFALSMSANGGAWATLAFVLPYIIFSPLAGELGNSYHKGSLLLYLKMAEIPLMILMSVALIYHLTAIMFLVTFLSGVQASFISPVRFSLIPDLCSKFNIDILKVNGLMDGSMFASLLVGTTIGLMLPINGHEMIPHSISFVIGISVVTSVLGLIVTYLLSRTKLDEQIYETMTWNWFQTVKKIFSDVRKFGKWNYVISISAFWGVASLMLSEAEPLAVKYGLEPSVIRMIVPMMSISIGLGSIVIALTRYRNILLFSGLMLVSSLFLLIPVSSHAFLIFSSIIFIICCAGGMLSSALYADVMKNTAGHTASIMASNNICNSFAMGLFSLIPIVLSSINSIAIFIICMILAFPFILLSTKPTE